MNSSFKAIIFDLGGVILNIDYEKTIKAFKELGITNFNDLYTQAKQNHVFDNFEMGKISSVDFRDYIRKTSGTNLNDKQIDTAWNAMLLDLPLKRIKLLKELAKACPIYLYSNTNEIHLTAFRRSINKQYGDDRLLEKLFIKTYYSHELNMRKPNADGFLKIINDNNLEIESTLFIDDSKQHIEGAKKIGLQTIWLEQKDITEIF
jgi:FMN phosphatase YigB (HAD superfamily)